MQPHRRILPIAALLLLPACYGALEAPDVAPPEPEAVTPDDRPELPSAAGSGEAGAALSQLGPVLTKLATEERAPARRPGAGAWRSAELQKLAELTVQLCGGAGCGEAMNQVAAAQIPGDELLPLLGRFMGPLKSQAETGFTTLGRRLLTDPVGTTRDRAFRMAIGAGVTRRGDPDGSERRAALVPQSPKPGAAVVLLVELGAVCPEVDATFKGPDDSGRIDLDLRADCEGVEPPTPGADGLPVTRRAVWGHGIDAMTENGVSIWLTGADAPLLDYTPVLGPTGK